MTNADASGARRRYEIEAGGITLQAVDNKCTRRHRASGGLRLRELVAELVVLLPRDLPVEVGLLRRL